jgi:hypothetical protein
MLPIRIAAALPGNRQDGCRLAAAGDQRRAIDNAFANFGDVAEIDRRLVLEGDDDAADVVEAGDLAGGQDQVLQIVLRQPANRRDLIGVLQRFGDLVEGDFDGVQLLRIDDH